MFKLIEFTAKEMAWFARVREECAKVFPDIHFTIEKMVGETVLAVRSTFLSETGDVLRFRFPRSHWQQTKKDWSLALSAWTMTSRLPVWMLRIVQRAHARYMRRWPVLMMEHKVTVDMVWPLLKTEVPRPIQGNIVQIILHGNKAEESATWNFSTDLPVSPQAYIDNQELRIQEKVRIWGPQPDDNLRCPTCGRKPSI